MAYLDVMPMTVALRTTPEAFRLERGYLRHMPSAHDFVFDGARHVTIRAQCGCAYLSIKPEQEPELISAYEQWRNEYWRPLQVNQEFASHFRARSPWRQALVRFTRWLHELSLRPERTPQREPAAVPTPEFVG